MRHFVEDCFEQNGIQRHELHAFLDTDSTEDII